MSALHNYDCLILTLIQKNQMSLKLVANLKRCAGLEKIEWVREAKYLGIYIVAGSTFKVNF